MQTKPDNDALRSLTAFALVIVLGVGAITGAKYWGYFHPHTSFAWLVGMGRGTPPLPPLPKDGNVRIEGPSDFKTKMTNSMDVLKVQAPNSYAKYVKPTLRVIQFVSTSQAPSDNVGVINMGWWQLSDVGDGTLFSWSPASFPNVPATSNAIPRNVYSDPRWIAAVIAGFTVDSVGQWSEPNMSPAAPACAQFQTLKEMGVYLQYTDPNSCTVASGGGH